MLLWGQWTSLQKRRATKCSEERSLCFQTVDKRGVEGTRGERRGEQVGKALLTLHGKLCSLSVCFVFIGEKNSDRVARGGKPGTVLAFQGMHCLTHKLQEKETV